MLTADNLYSENWLLAYEVKARNWLRNTDDYLEKDGFFKKLKDNSVRFYHPEQKLDISRVKVGPSSPSMINFTEKAENEMAKTKTRKAVQNSYPPKNLSEKEKKFYADFFGEPFPET